MRMKAVIIMFFLISSCSNDMKEVDNLMAEYEIYKEVAKDVTIYYSDSAQVKIKISGPIMERHIGKANSKEVFPNGVLVEFLSKNGKPYSWLEADRAVRDHDKDIIVSSGNVKFYNSKNEKLESPELIWDDKNEIVRTDKFVRITQPEKGDTTYGYGFEANQEFTRFEIKNKVQGRLNVDRMKSSF